LEGWNVTAELIVWVLGSLGLKFGYSVVNASLIISGYILLFGGIHQ
jgi:hypothetical protein